MILTKITKVIGKLKNRRHSEKNFDLDILGSCVSRDVFNFDLNKDIKLGKYFARSSFISTVSEPFPEEFNLEISSSWQKKVAEADLKKEVFNELSNNSANYLLLDLIDERLSLMKCKNSIFTLSMGLKNSNFLEVYECDYINRYELDESVWKKSMDKYLKNLLKIYPEEKIIIHETYNVKSFRTKTGEINSFPEKKVEYYEKDNKLFEEYYNYIKLKLPKAKVVNILKDQTLANENHMWGLSPVHYEDSYYEDLLIIIIDLIRN